MTRGGRCNHPMLSNAALPGEPQLPINVLVTMLDFRFLMYPPRLKHK